MHVAYSGSHLGLSKLSILQYVVNSCICTNNQISRAAFHFGGSSAIRGFIKIYFSLLYNLLLYINIWLENTNSISLNYTLYCTTNAVIIYFQDLVFNVEDVQKIVRDNIELCLGGNAYSHSRCPHWISIITDKTLARLNKLNKPFKYIGKIYRIGSYICFF